MMAQLLHLSDIHLAGPASRPLHGRDGDLTLDRVLSAAARHQAQAVVVTGDLVDHGRVGDRATNGYERLHRRLSALGMPVRCVPGNHDDPAYLYQFCPEWRSALHVDEWLVVPMDTHWPGHDAGMLTRCELARLDALLAGPGEHPVVLAMHHPAVAPCAAADCVLSNAPALRAYLRRQPRIRVVLSGHQHQPFTITRDGITFVGAPSTWLQAQHIGADFVRTSQPPGYQVVRLGPDGTVSTETCWAW